MCLYRHSRSPEAGPAVPSSSLSQPVTAPRGPAHLPGHAGAARKPPVRPCAGGRGRQGGCRGPRRERTPLGMRRPCPSPSPSPSPRAQERRQPFTSLRDRTLGTQVVPRTQDTWDQKRPTGKGKRARAVAQGDNPKTVCLLM